MARPGIVLLLVMFLPGVVARGQLIMVYTFKEISVVEVTDSGKLSAQAFTDNRPLRIVFAGLATKRPAMKGNIGESELKVLRDEGNQIWLAEEPPLGGRLCLYAL